MSFLSLSLSRLKTLPFQKGKDLLALASSLVRQLLSGAELLSTRQFLGGAHLLIQDQLLGDEHTLNQNWYNGVRPFLDDTSSHQASLPQHEDRPGPWGRVLMELPDHDRFQHRYVLGKTGTGKSTLLGAMMLDDIARGDGLFYVDPHGEDADRLLERIPPARRADTILFDPSDDENVCPINLLADVAPDWRPFVASSLVDTFKSIWGYDMLATPVMDQYLYNSVAALLEAPDATLMDIRFMLTSQNFRDRTIDHVCDPAIRAFWQNDFASLNERDRRETARSTLNKIGALLADPRMRGVIAYPKSMIRIEDILEQQKILIARLPQGRLGLQKTQMLGSLLLARFHMAVLARQGRKPFHIYLDECHHFAPGTLTEMLSGIRKFGVSLTLCHQYISQLMPRLREAILGTVGTKIVFRVGLADAEALRHEFPVNPVWHAVSETPPYQAQISLPSGRSSLKLEAGQQGSGSLETAKRIRAFSRRHHTIKRTRVERHVARRFHEAEGTVKA
ncbi:MAG: type IV secretory system conjugative DNA transfer family protein [Notoacmeibacter sp.]|nr:type IV secretory system conjugative DNA transfer family protein [Notoacmeibacter sp.]